MKKFIYILFLFVIFAGLSITKQINATSHEIQAEVNKEANFGTSSYELISPIGNLKSLPDQSEGSFSDFVNLIIRIAIALAGAIAVITIMVNGIQYMGSDSVWKKGENKSKMTAAVGGLVLLFCSYLILYTINPDLVNIKIGGISKLSGAEWEYTETTDYDAVPITSAAECKGGLVKIPDSVERKAGVHDNICKELADKLLILKNKMGSVDWIITATTNGQHFSSCHKKNQPKTGACVDIALRKNGSPVPSTDVAWGTLCKAVLEIPGLSFLNEASNHPECLKGTQNTKTKFGTGPHLHVNYTGQ